MELEPYISIVVPIKNEATYIKKCLLAVLNQNYPASKVSIIIVDNGSTDNSQQIIANIAQSHNRIKCISKPEGTIAAVRNCGAAQAQGKVLAFLDADCVPSKNWLSEGVRLLITEKAGCVGFVEPERDGSAPWVERTWQYICSSNIDQELVDVTWLSSFNLILWKDVFNDVGGFTEKLVTCEDADLGYRIAKKQRLIMSNRAKVHHLGDPKSIKEFFLKEFWRGQSNLRSFFLSSNKMHDFWSVFVPVGYVLLLVLCLIALAKSIVLINSFILFFLFLSALGLLLLPIALTIKKGKKIKNFRTFLQASYLFFLYLVARGLAVVRIKLV